jgi:NAD(P)H-hydrate epimerase
MLRLTREQLRRIDQRATSDYGIPGIVLMENAARAAADVACQMMQGDCVGEVLILCGGGNNGADGMALERPLDKRGCEVLIQITIDPERYQGDALTNYRIAQKMNLAIEPLNLPAIASTPAILIVDAVFGTGLTRPPREPFDQIAHTINGLRIPVLAIDLPSGMDCDTGKTPGACIKATRTVTFVAEKLGFDEPAARQLLGLVTVADIGCPRELILDVAKQMTS